MSAHREAYRLWKAGLPGDRFAQIADKTRPPKGVPRKHHKLFRWHYARNLRDGYDDFGSYFHAIRACGCDAEKITGRPMPYMMLY